jgi:catechol-2,3-dioxygenase
MHAPGAQFRLVLSTGGRPDNRGALNHFALSVADSDALAAWVARLDAIGIAHEGIHASSVGETVDLFDPDGNNVELISEA